MRVDNRDEIVARLRRLPEILSKSDSELAHACGIKPSTWSNYKSPTGSQNIIFWQVALQLWNAYGVPMEWVYDGQVGRVTDPGLRERLALAAKRPRRASRGRRRVLPVGQSPIAIDPK